MTRVLRLPRISLLLLAAAVVPLAVFLVDRAPPAHAQAQTTDALVANTGQTKEQSGLSLTSERVQAFTTGSNAEGYTLTGIDFHFHTATRFYLSKNLLKTLTASVWTSGGTTLSGTGTINDLGTKLADLTVPPIETTGVVTFAAPAGTTLAASTTYYVVIGSGDFDEDTHLLLSNTISDDEDTGGAADFSIANVSHNLAAGTWLENGGSVALSIGVKGYGRVTVSESSVRLFTGSTATYTIKLNKAPTANVTITPTSGTTAVATVSPPSLTFTTTNYGSAQTVTVTSGRAGRSTITHAATSADTAYPGTAIGGVSVTVVAPPAYLSQGDDGCGIWELDVAVGDGTRDQVKRISKDWTNPTEVKVSTGNPEITVKRQALDRYVLVYRFPFLNSLRSTVPNRARFPDRYFRFYLTDPIVPEDPETVVIEEAPLEVGESRMLRILLSIKHEKLEECDNKHLISYYLKVTRVASGDLGFVESPQSTSGESGDTPPPPNQTPTVSSAISDTTITDELGSQVIPLSDVFADGDGDQLTLEATSSNMDVAVAFVQYIDGAEVVVLAVQRGTAQVTVTADDERGGTVSDKFTVTVKAAPSVASAIDDISKLPAETSKQISLSGVFTDADGDALTLSASSSNTDVVTVTAQLDPNTGLATAITLTGVSSGTATITVTAEDTDGNQVSDTFDVTVPPGGL